MKTSLEFEGEDVVSLVNRYAKAAATHGRATETGDHKQARAAHEQIAAVYRELRRRGERAQQSLLPLLCDPDLGVRSWAGAHALEFAPTQGEPALLTIAEIPNSLVSFSAKTTLQQWRAGKLRFP